MSRLPAVDIRAWKSPPPVETSARADDGGAAIRHWEPSGVPRQEAKDPSPPPGTVTTVTCTPLTDPLRRLLNRLAGTTGVPTDTLASDGIDEARRYGWVYEFQGRVALTGAGAYHVGEISGGMLGG